jgi:hypothetical protein
MKRLRLTLLACFAAAFAASALIGAGSAGAAGIYKYNLQMSGPNNSVRPEAYGSYDVTSLDVSKSVNVQVRHGANPSYSTQTAAAGPNMIYGPQNLIGLAPGDTIEVRQPSGAVAPTESYVIPPLTVNIAAGSRAVTGTVPAGLQLDTEARTGCKYNNTEDDHFGASTGSFSHTLAAPAVPGDWFRAQTYSATGDVTGYYAYVPGETPCLGVSAFPSGDPTPGMPPDPKPYQLYVSNLADSVTTTVRIVHRRGAAVLSSTNYTATYVSDYDAEPALPGDVYELYRPQGAATPTYTYAVPQVSSIFDPSVDLVAVDAPAGSMVMALPCRQFSCPDENLQELLNPLAGRTFFDFSRPSPDGSAVDLLPTDRIYAEYDSPSGDLHYSIRSTPGDLVAPTQSIKLPNKIKLASLLKALKKGYKVKLTSNEPGTAKLALTLPAATTSAKKKSKPVTLATASKAVKAGTNSITLKFTKSGKKALKKLSKKHSRSVVLSSTVTDASGNASTIAKTAKIKP